ncbi:hypothetical protein [Mycolicibacterium sp. P1-5]|uniref:hypothetical protein n=1 Tax=Mycolicibacterium sp. P1-5 TaxID=2024617 RepID=UPI0011EECB13|nr:hypothetical protein [Mycolicibacterium sp. P1-5]KAA0108705.1 hypothetical protein CIW47_14175 [Mycolicibacterium sp. P1-5]
MIKSRVASAAAIFSFGIAALGGAVVAVAAPASADTQPIVQVEGTSMNGTAGQAVNDARMVPDELADATRGPHVAAVPAPGSAAAQEHTPFPHNAAPHSEHNGQGHKGSNELGEH